MEETYQTRVIILNKQPWREYDARVILYSEDNGRQELIARGAKKISSKLSAHLEPISLVDIMVVRGKQLDYIGSARTEKSYIKIKNNLDSLSAATQIISIFEKLVRGREIDKKLFNLLQKAFDLLETTKLSEEKCELLPHFFSLKILSEMGYRPELHSCVVCAKKITPTKNSFDLSRGGLICFNCSNTGSDTLTISDNCIKVLRIGVDNNLDKLVKLKIDRELSKELAKIISSFYKYNL